MTCLGMRIQDTVHPVENGPQSDVVDDLRPLIAPLYAASARIIDAGTITTEDIRDLLSLMPRAVDLVWRRGSGPVQCDEAGETLPMPLLISPCLWTIWKPCVRSFASTGNISLAIGSTRGRKAS